jgi:XTP/dITP diphosphohydrolase
MSEKLLVATKNLGKVQEFAEMLADVDVAFANLADVDVTFDVEETGTTFQENAILKAEAYAKATGMITIADDSGLVVDALDGAPGVYTARYGGAGLTAVQRYQHLLSNIADVPWAQRSARFCCYIVVVDRNGRLLAEAEGICEGMIAESAAGEGGFGYDPVFYLSDYQKTMAELPAATKHQISHRGRALQQLVPQIKQILTNA